MIRRAARRGMMMRRRRVMRRRMRRRMIVGGMVLVAAGTSAVKMSQQDAQKIEQQTGKKPEDLSEAELDQAMEAAGIEGQEPTDQEIAQLEAEENKSPSV